MKVRNLSITFCTLFFLLSYYSLEAEDYNFEKKVGNWSKIFKKNKLTNFRNQLDSAKYSYPEPFLTIHLGVSYATNHGNVQLNSAQAPGTMINLRNDLGYPKSYILPRLNAIVNFGNLKVFAFDTYNFNKRSNEVIGKDIKYGNSIFPAGTYVKTRISLNYVSLNYIRFFYNNGRTRVAFMAGVTGLFYNLRINNPPVNITEQKSILVPLPNIGLNGSIYLCKNLFVRAVVKYSAWWSKNYNCNVLDVNPYFEYYIHKNFGVGMRYNFGYTSLQNLPDNKFNGSIKNSFNAISAILVFRFLKKENR